MRTRELLIFVIGFVMLGLGVTLLTIFGEGGFFVFPFFFVGDSGYAIYLLIFALAVMILFFWWANYQYPEDVRFKKYQDSRNEFLRVGGQCKYCGSPLPEKSMFCSSCGSSVDFNVADDNSF